MVGCGSLRYIISRHGSNLTLLSTSVTTRTLATYALTKDPALFLRMSCNNNNCLNSATAIQVRRYADSKEVNENVEKFRRGESQSVRCPEDLPHFRRPASQPTAKLASEEDANKDINSEEKKEMPPIGTYVLPHPIWVLQAHITNSRMACSGVLILQVGGLRKVRVNCFPKATATWHGRESNPRPPDRESDALTTLPR
ncbi:alternative oxidase [Elysia marginata]|uniref:Alternative oxidase n=1 Tax=Elysia marginata TaxID=1093978 RepID=A0AAV4FEI6_9GAST|nr:alternative oxidase [Elysia marginata]